MRRGLLLLLLLPLFTSATTAEDGRSSDDSVATGNGVVIHGVDSKLLAARLHDTDRKALAGDAKGAASDLAEILAGDLTPLVEDGENSFLCIGEAAVQRVAALAPEGLAAYREIVDPRAAAVLAGSLAHADAAALARHAVDMAMSTHGPKILVTLADLRAARGETRAAVRALTDLLRLWPDAGATAEMPGVDRAAAVLRLASLHASLGDEGSVRWLARETSAKLLDGPSPTKPGAKLSDDLARCAESAARRADAAPASVAGELHVAAEYEFVHETGDDVDSTYSREIDERPLAIGAPGRPTLLTRRPQGQVVALAPAAERRLEPLWSWPSSEELLSGLRRDGRGPFAPARCGDLVLFAWPSVRDVRSTGESRGRFESSEDGPNTLVALSIRGEGRLVDERGGRDEKLRDDADAELVPPEKKPADAPDDEPRAPRELSFCGKPLVLGDAVFTTLIRRTENGGATELHVARFDVVDAGAAKRLRLRWRRRVLDGIAMPPLRFAAEQSNETEDPLATPASMTERWGRVYVLSDTGAVACLDADDGRPAWVHAYPRFGPQRRSLVAAPQRPYTRTWKDVPVVVDGPHVWAAPRDAKYLFQYRAMPRLARTTLLRSWRFQAGAGTSTEPGPLLSNLEPDELLGVSQGVGWFAGERKGPTLSGLAPVGSPLAALRMRDGAPGEPRRVHAYAQIAESVPAGSPCLVRGAVLFPSFKAIYRVDLDQFESAPRVLWQPDPAPRDEAAPDAIGSLVPDGERLWSVTPHRAVLLERK